MSDTVPSVHVGGWPIEKRPIVALIPAFDEEKTIAKVIVKTKMFSDRVIVCDDGSTDDTAIIAEALGVEVIRHSRNLGKGEALRSLVAEAKHWGAGVFVTLDGDDQHDPADIPDVVAPILSGQADLVVGSRAMRFPEMPFDRALGNRVLDAVTNASAGSSVSDTQSGFRAYSPKAIEQIDFTGRGMTIESQTIIDAAKAGLRIKEVPVSTRYWKVAAKRSRLTHFSEVVDFTLSRTIVGNPLLYLGIPGIVAVLAGFVLGAQVVAVFGRTGQIALGTGLIGVTLVLLGAIMVSTSLILKFLSVRLRQ